MTTPIKDEEDIIIDPSLIEEPDEEDDDDTTWSDWDEDQFGFDKEKLTIEGESVIDDEEFDEDWEDIYDPYEEDPGILDEDDDL